MMEIACTCSGLPSHSHVFASSLPDGTLLDKRVDTGEVRIWVNWKDVARELMVDGDVQAR